MAIFVLLIKYSPVMDLQKKQMSFKMFCFGKLHENKKWFAVDHYSISTMFNVFVLFFYKIVVSSYCLYNGRQNNSDKFEPYVYIGSL